LFFIVYLVYIFFVIDLWFFDRFHWPKKDTHIFGLTPNRLDRWPPHWPVSAPQYMYCTCIFYTVCCTYCTYILCLAYCLCIIVCCVCMISLWSLTCCHCMTNWPVVGCCALLLVMVMYVLYVNTVRTG
jgi:hypothetical protein